MTTTATESALVIPLIALDAQHEHTRRCYWDFRECRWQCSKTSGQSRRPSLHR
jgi:hypothetical protein